MICCGTGLNVGDKNVQRSFSFAWSLFGWPIRHKQPSDHARSTRPETHRPRVRGIGTRQAFQPVLQQCCKTIKLHVYLFFLPVLPYLVSVKTQLNGIQTFISFWSQTCGAWLTVLRWVTWSVKSSMTITKSSCRKERKKKKELYIKHLMIGPEENS